MAAAVQGDSPEDAGVCARALVRGERALALPELPDFGPAPSTGAAAGKRMAEPSSWMTPQRTKALCKPIGVNIAPLWPWWGRV